MRYQYADKLNLEFFTGDIILADFCNNVGHQQGGVRPALIVSNNVGNVKSPMLEVLPITTKRIGSHLPTHVILEANETNGLKYDSTVEAEGKIPINKFQVIKKLGKISEEKLELVAAAMVYATPIVVKAFNKGVQDTQFFQNLYNA